MSETRGESRVERRESSSQPAGGNQSLEARGLGPAARAEGSYRVKGSWKPPELQRGRWRRRLPWAVAGVAALLAIAYFAGVLGNSGSQEPAKPVDEGPPPVVSASGAVVPASRTRLSFTTTGRVRRIAVQPGDRVREGQLLAQLEPSTVQSGGLGGSTAGPGTPDFYLVAPFDGTVGLVPVREWETVTPATPVIFLGDLTQLRVEIEDLSETDVGRLKEGQSVDIAFESFPGSKVKGRVARISPMNNAKGGGVNYDLVVEFTDSSLPPLRWGMTAHVDILVGQER